MFAEQRSRLALLRTLIFLAGAGLVGVGAGQAVAGPGASDPALPPDCQRAVPFDPRNFQRSTRIDNEFLPLTPGTQLVLEGWANLGGGPLPHTVTFTVTNLTKMIHGVPTRVLWDVDENEGEVVEAELAFFAQDDEGNVWNLGEYPEVYEDGSFLGAPHTWIDGVRDAEGGIHMLDRPDVGNSYLQGYAPDIEFLDCATVFDEAPSTCVPLRCFEDVLLTHERSPLDPDGGVQTKAHAPRLGIVEVGALDDPEGETLVLVERLRLDEASMEAVREEALKLDQRAYRVSEVYRETEPIEPLPQAPPEVPQLPPAVAPLPPAATVTSPGEAAPSPLATAPPAASPAGPKPASQPRSCYAKRSRRSARRAYRLRYGGSPPAPAREQCSRSCRGRRAPSGSAAAEPSATAPQRDARAVGATSYTASALKRFMFSVIATSVGRRSMLEAPKKPATPVVRSST